MSFKRSIAKTAVSIIYHSTITTVSTIAIKAVVQPEADSTEESVCELGGFAVGTAIWWKTTENVQSVVDVVADKATARRIAKPETPSAA